MKDQKENRKTYASGAVRSGGLPRFRDIDYGFLRRVALAFSEGAEKYEENQGFEPWEKNWKLGDREFAVEVLDHMLDHAVLLKEQLLALLTGDYAYEEHFGIEDHLGHLGANLVMLDYFQRMGYFDYPRYEPVTETPDTPPSDESDDGVTQLDEPKPWLNTIKQALGLS